MSDQKTEFQNQIEQSSEFRQIQRNMARKNAKFREGLERKREENAEFQRRKMMTKDEKCRDAIDRMGKSIQTFESAKQGREVSYDESRAKAEKLAKRAGFME